MKLGYDFSIKRAIFTRKINSKNKNVKVGKQNLFAKDSNKFANEFNMEYVEVIYRDWYYGWWKVFLILPLALWWKHKSNQARFRIKLLMANGWKPSEELTVKMIIVQFTGIPFDWDGTWSLYKLEDVKEIKKLFKDFKKGLLIDNEKEIARKDLKKWFEKNKNSLTLKNKEKIERQFKKYAI